jgi:TatD DNase family protein
MVTYKNAAELRSVATRVPLGRLLLETDSPYLAPVPVRGRRNEPAFVVHTAECIARERGIPLEALAAQTTQNARTLFKLGGTS